MNIDAGVADRWNGLPLADILTVSRTDNGSMTQIANPGRRRGIGRTPGSAPLLRADVRPLLGRAPRTPATDEHRGRTVQRSARLHLRHLHRSVIAHYLPLRDVLVARGEIGPESPEILLYIITSGSAAMFASRALAERLFVNAPVSPERVDEFADAFADLVVNVLRGAVN